MGANKPQRTCIAFLGSTKRNMRITIICLTALLVVTAATPGRVIPKDPKDQWNRRITKEEPQRFDRITKEEPQRFDRITKKEPQRFDRITKEEPQRFDRI